MINYKNKMEEIEKQLNSTRWNKCNFSQGYDGWDPKSYKPIDCETARKAMIYSFRDMVHYKWGEIKENDKKITLTHGNKILKLYKTENKLVGVKYSDFGGGTNIMKMEKE